MRTVSSQSFKINFNIILQYYLLGDLFLMVFGLVLHALLIFTKLVTYPAQFSFICFNHINMHVRRQLHKLSLHVIFFCCA
jgi:Zn-dependent membrane protease YugP